MLSGGNPTGGGNPSGIGTNLNYIGNHVYATSGIVACDNTATTLIGTTTGSQYMIVRLDFGTGSVSTRDMLWKVLLDNQEVYSYVTAGTNQQGSDAQNSIKLLIPGQSKLQITCENVSDSNSENQSVVITGRVY
jgi:hypothetical protein